MARIMIREFFFFIFLYFFFSFFFWKVHLFSLKGNVLGTRPETFKSAYIVLLFIIFVFEPEAII